MNNPPPANLIASVRQRLLNQSRELKEDFNLTLVRYGVERFLYRLAQSPYSDRFVLKGATLFAVWTKEMYRPTRDLDLLGHGDSSADILRNLFVSLCTLEVEPDGLIFDPASIRVTEIREDQEYPGQRVRLKILLGKAEIPLQIDIGFGDVITPKADEITYPTILGGPAPRLKAYPRETVIAEKLQAMTELGILNTRIKDFYDMWVMSQKFTFQGPLLIQAIRSTFQRRQTEIARLPPIALTPEFGENVDKVNLWRAFLERNRLEIGQVEFAEVIVELQEFLLPPLRAISSQVNFNQQWLPGGPWISTE
jgi:hypothetical protein